MPHIAVLDVETTGLNPYRHDRIVEVAVVVLATDGTPLREFATLVNPERDIGPTHVHGLHSSDVVGAPRFSELAGVLAQELDGSVAVAGHNVRFDISFLAAEFGRLGRFLPETRTLCTMRLSGGGGLQAACSDYGIEFDGKAHSALTDARATARLLAELLRDDPLLAREILQWTPTSWLIVPAGPVVLRTRQQSREQATKPPHYLQRILSRMGPDLGSECEADAVQAYVEMLDRALEDRRIDENEGDALWELASRWGLSANQVQRANWSYFVRLVAAAYADSIVTDAEQRDLDQVASLLGLGGRNLDENIELAKRELMPREAGCCSPTKPALSQDPGGKRVCFTGESQCVLRGETITRELASQLATKHGMTVLGTVTKNLDILVVADPFTQSGKAKKARQYGIRILHEHVFWRLLGLEVE